MMFWRADGRVSYIAIRTREAPADNDNGICRDIIEVHLLLVDGRGLQLRSLKFERDGSTGTTISRGVGERRAGLLCILYSASLAGMLGLCRVQTSLGKSRL
jgi:hypothetical protein